MAWTAPRTPCSLALALALLASAWLGCQAEPAGPRLVLLYAPCTVNKFFLSPYGVEPSFTPNLARFAERATTFHGHRTEAGSSGIAYASLFTGAQADRHGVYHHPTKLDEEIVTIGEVFARDGYDTFFWDGQGMASGKLGYGQGVPAEQRYGKGLRADDERFQRILARLRDDPDYRAFVMTNFTITHGPYSVRHIGPWLSEHPDRSNLHPADLAKLLGLYREHYLALAYNTGPTLERLGLQDRLPDLATAIEVAYRSNVSQLDRRFGAVLDALDAHGLRDQSLVVFTSDHGEVLYRESAVFPWTHSSSLDREVLEVALLIAGPGVRAGSFEGVTRSIDVLPTLAELAGANLAPSDGIAGRSLAAVARRQSEPAPAPAYSHTGALPSGVIRQMGKRGAPKTWGLRAELFPRQDEELAWVAAREGDWTFRLERSRDLTWGVKAFDLASDPFEALDRFDPEDPAHAAASERLQAYKRHHVDAWRARGGAETVPGAEQEELLRGLGYIR